MTDHRQNALDYAHQHKEEFLDSLKQLVAIPSISTDPEAARIYFQKLRRLRDFLSKRVSQAEWNELSMGTSADYAVAVEEGATLVRIGQAILGPRPDAEDK